MIDLARLQSRLAPPLAVLAGVYLGLWIVTALLGCPQLEVFELNRLSASASDGSAGSLATTEVSGGTSPAQEFEATAFSPMPLVVLIRSRSTETVRAGSAGERSTRLWLFGVHWELEPSSS